MTTDRAHLFFPWHDEQLLRSLHILVLCRAWPFCSCTKFKGLATTPCAREIDRSNKGPHSNSCFLSDHYKCTDLKKDYSFGSSGFQTILLIYPLHPNTLVVFQNQSLESSRFSRLASFGRPNQVATREQARLIARKVRQLWASGVRPQECAELVHFHLTDMVAYPPVQGQEDHGQSTWNHVTVAATSGWCRQKGQHLLR